MHSRSIISFRAWTKTNSNKGGDGLCYLILHIPGIYTIWSHSGLRSDIVIINGIQLGKHPRRTVVDDFCTTLDDIVHEDTDIGIAL